jgi:hypothetical protein
MVMVGLAAVASLLKGNPNHDKFIICVTNFILIASDHHHDTKTILKYLQDADSAISTNIHLVLPYHKSHSMSKIRQNSFPSQVHQMYLANGLSQLW